VLSARWWDTPAAAGERIVIFDGSVVWNDHRNQAVGDRNRHISQIVRAAFAQSDADSAALGFSDCERRHVM
jgi:hypothetical protein